MIGSMGLQSVAEALGATLHNGDCTFSRISTDTRALEAGDLFLALRGENFDAHHFLALAAERGACGLVVEKADASLPLPQLQVDDTLKALGQIAGLNRQRFNQPLIAITGSGGKTTVKGMLASILRRCGSVLATRGNLNNHIGVPLTLLELEGAHQFAVIEMGASALGEITYLCDLAQPQVALVTNVMAAHIEGFGSLDGVAAAKGEIYQGLVGSGHAVINADEPYAHQWLNQLPTHQVIRFSCEDATAEVKVTAVEDLGFHGLSFELSTPLGAGRVQMGIIGNHNLANAAAAAAAALAVGADLTAIVEGLEAFQPVAGRMHLKQAPSGAAVIDDSYNANPGSVRAAIEALMTESKRVPGRQSILVLGDLGELGPEARSLHSDLGHVARDAGINRLVTVGTLSQYAADAFGTGALHCEDHGEAISLLQTQMDKSTVVLVKGSRSARMETVVQALVAPSSGHGEKE